MNETAAGFGVTADAEAALKKFHEDRNASSAQAMEDNKAAEKAAAEALANETNPWNTVAGLVDVHHASAQTSNLSSYNKCLLDMKTSPVSFSLCLARVSKRIVHSLNL